MSLNSVVNSLVRAAAGIPTEISDADLDRHVAELLAAEAKQRELKWSELGLSGLLGGTGRDSPDPSLPKPNKRFLASVIRTVDGHNNALLRGQAQAARDARAERRGESSRSGAGRLLGGALRDMGGGSNGLGRSRRDAEDRFRMKGEAERAARGVERRKGDQEGGYYSTRSGRREDENDERPFADRRSFRDRERRGGENGYSGEGGVRQSRREIEETGHRGHRDERKGRIDGNEHSSRAKRRYSDEETSNDEQRRSRSRGHGRQDGDDLPHRRHHQSGGHPKRSDNGDNAPADGRRSRKPDHDVYEEEDGNNQKRRERGSQKGKDHHPVHQARDERGQTADVKHIARSALDEQSSRGSTRHSVQARRPEGQDKDEALTDTRSQPGSERNGHRIPRPLPSKPSLPLERPPPPPDEPVPPLPPSPDHPRLSRMDKYFTREYDPRLDVGEVPKEGMIAAVGWDNMLAVLKERGHKKRRHSPDLSEGIYDAPSKHVVRSPSPWADSSARQLEKAEKRKRKEAKEKRLGDSYDVEEEKEREKRREKRRKDKEALAALGAATNGGVDVFGVKYVPKGGIREWDLGK